jgi:hypothetical protein
MTAAEVVAGVPVIETTLTTTPIPLYYEVTSPTDPDLKRRYIPAGAAEPSDWVTG